MPLTKMDAPARREIGTIFSNVLWLDLEKSRFLLGKKLYLSILWAAAKHFLAEPSTPLTNIFELHILGEGLLYLYFHLLFGFNKNGYDLVSRRTMTEKEAKTLIFLDINEVDTKDDKSHHQEIELQLQKEEEAYLHRQRVEIKTRRATSPCGKRTVLILDSIKEPIPSQLFEELERRENEALDLS